MEQHFSISVRTFKKMCAAVILVFSGFSSAMAEKLDTTFVLDMVIDNTLCHFTKYNSAGEVIDSGLYNGSEGFSQINLGYVTDSDGNSVDTLYYVCDRVTKQWCEKSFSELTGRPEYEQISFYGNGMLYFVGDTIIPEYYDYNVYLMSCTSLGFLMTFQYDVYNRPGHSYNQRALSSIYDDYGNLVSLDLYFIDHHPEYEEKSQLKITYDNVYEYGNLVQSKIEAIDNDLFHSFDSDPSDTPSVRDSLKKYYYDSLNRRTKTEVFILENSNYVLVDSIVYTYSSPNTALFFSSLSYNGSQVIEFSNDNSNVFDYQINADYDPSLLKYTLPKNVIASQTYDDSNKILTISLRFMDGGSTQSIDYRLHFRPSNGVDDFFGNNVRLYVVDRTICVDGFKSPVAVCDITGRLVGMGSGESVRIPVSQTGIFVVKSSGVVSKVIVE